MVLEIISQKTVGQVQADNAATLMGEFMNELFSAWNIETSLVEDKDEDAFENAEENLKDFLAGQYPDMKIRTQIEQDALEQNEQEYNDMLTKEVKNND